MFYELIKEASDAWWAQPDCPCQPFLQYILERGKLRDAQIEAIRHYLYLKVVHDSKPLYQIFTEHTFGTLTDEDISQSGCYSLFREENIPLHNLAYYAKVLSSKGEALPQQFKKILAKHHQEIDASQALLNIFYGIDYADYLFSLPMGAGKTFLMACFIYIDLYFSHIEPENEAFAQNFLILIPSGLKSSIMPSLKSIQEFDPSWILPPEVAQQIAREVKFEVLDESRSASKSNRTKNQNAQKINAHAPLNRLRGLVAITNAEKLIDRLDKLDKLGEKDPSLLTPEDIAQMRNDNELRQIVGQIPHLSLLIDEVHHASDRGIKLRQFVTLWAAEGQITTVLGFSGTPYLSKAEEIAIYQSESVKLKTISNIVYYFPLIEGVGNFLKLPQIKYADQGGEEIIRQGVQEFIKMYGDTRYSNGTSAKLAIYCGQIETLETEVYPLVSELVTAIGWDPAKTILKYHRGNGEYPQPDDAEYQFSSLDTPISPYRIILLVQIGKEGWDCRSLTSVILPHKVKSSQNMVLQTSCRCLREVTDATTETALIWLNRDNAETLNSQLKKQQRTDIDQLNKRRPNSRFIDRCRYSRLKETQLTDPIRYYQLRIKYQLEVICEELHTQERLESEEIQIPSDKTLITVQSITGAIINRESTLASLQIDETTLPITFRAWIGKIQKESFGTLTYSDLMAYEESLRSLFHKITIQREGKGTYLSPHYDQQAIRSEVRKAFVPQRKLQSSEEVVPETARLLRVEHLSSPITVPEVARYYPSCEEVDSIIAFDKGEQRKTLSKGVRAAIEALKASKAPQSLIDNLQNSPDSLETPDNLGATHSYHYLPYHFDSQLEEDIFRDTLLPMAQRHQLEVYFNGDDTLTEFAINCYTKRSDTGQPTGGAWRYIGRYYPDFLMIQRDKARAICKILIIETKGAGFAPLFQDKHTFVTDYFLQLNNKALSDTTDSYEMDFLYLEEQRDREQMDLLVEQKIKEFFQS